jgi:hypothetical protein
VFIIERGQPNNVIYDTTGNGSFVNVTAYGPPRLTSILQRTGDSIEIESDGLRHYPPNSANVTRSVLFERDSFGRITAIYDPNSGVTNNPAIQPSIHPAVRYVYHQDTGNLLQVLKLVDRSAGTYVTNRYTMRTRDFSTTSRVSTTRAGFRWHAICMPMTAG